MPMSPYILVLAESPSEAAKYIKLAKLPRGRWRIASSASSIRGIRRATVHRLPGFKKRPDKFAVLSVLKYARCDWVDVEMPDEPVEDQGDGMGPQLTLPGFTEMQVAQATSPLVAPTGDDQEPSEPPNGSAAMGNEGGPVQADEVPTPDEVAAAIEQGRAEEPVIPHDDAPVTPKARRRRTTAVKKDTPPAPAPEIF
jgi:hypothetical protein